VLVALNLLLASFNLLFIRPYLLLARLDILRVLLRGALISLHLAVQRHQSGLDCTGRSKIFAREADRFREYMPRTVPHSLDLDPEARKKVTDRNRFFSEQTSTRCDLGIVRDLDLHIIGIGRP